MASRLNNIGVSVKAVDDLNRFIRQNLPSIKTLISISNIESTTRRNSALAKEEEKITKDYTEALNENLNKTVEKITGKGLKQQLLVLKKSGVKITSLDLKEIQKEANASFFGKKYFGKKPEQRGKIIAKKTAKKLTRETRRLRTLSEPESQAKRVVNKIKGGKVQGFSYGRSSKRLLVAESHRAQANAIQYLSKEIGSEFTRWITVGDLRVVPLDKARGLGSDLNVKEKRILIKAGISIKGVYHTDTIPSMERHVGCRCTLAIVPGPGLELSHIVRNRKDEVLETFRGSDVVGVKASETLDAYVKGREFIGDFPGANKAQIERRKAGLKKAIEEKSFTPLKTTNRAFFNNVSKGQNRSVKDLAQILGKDVDDEWVNQLGVENAVRVILAKVPSGVQKKAIRQFRKIQKQRINQSVKVFDENIQLARKKKGMPIKNKRELLLAKTEYTKNLAAAREEMGQTVGYVDVQERIIRQLKNKSKRIVLNFEDRTKFNDYLKKYPGVKFRKFRSSNTLILDIDKTDFLVTDIKKETDKVRKIIFIKQGKFNKGTLDGKKKWKPRGMKKTILKGGEKIPFGLSFEQESVVRFMNESKAAIINAAPGTGKTVMSIGSIQELRAAGRVKKVLYVTKENLVGQAMDEFKIFTVKNPASGTRFVKIKRDGELITIQKRLSGDDRKQMYRPKEFILDERGKPKVDRKGNKITNPSFGKDVQIISHAQLKSDIHIIRKSDYDYIVVDEFQLLGSEGRFALNKVNPEYRFLLSGTPVQNNVDELWPSLGWIDKTLFKDRQEFIGLFSKAAKDTTMFQQSVYRSINNKMKTRMITRKSQLKPFVLRKINVKLTSANKVKIEKLDKRYNKVRGAAKVRIRKKRQDFLDGNLVEKQQAVRAILKQHKGLKKIIFVKNKGQAAAVQKFLEKSGVRKKAIVRFDTSISVDERDAVRKSFKESVEKEIVIMDAQSSAGVDFHEANVLVHWTKPSNAAIWEQRTARSWRKGVVGKSFIYNLDTNTVEDSLRNLSLRKSKKILTAFQEAETVDDVGILSLIKSER